MFRRRRAARLIAALTLTVAGALAAAAPATAAPAPDVTELRAAADRITAGKGTAADLATVNAVPEFSRTVVDPSRTVHEFEQGTPTRVVTRGPDGADSGTVLAGNWAYVRANYYSTLGFHVYTWRHYVYWQYDGHVITAYPDRSDSLEWTDGTAYMDTGFSQRGGYTGGYYGFSWMQRHMRHCYASWGCGSSYPWGQIDVTAQGLATWRSGVS